MREELRKENQHEVTNLEMAGFGPRWGAILVDYNILFIIIYILSKILAFVELPDIPIKPSIGFLVSSYILFLTAGPLIGIFYRSIFESSIFQGTPGKIAVKIKVVNLNGQRISFLQALKRNFGRLISSLILYLGFFMVLWDENKNTFHDNFAKTYVVMNDYRQH